MQQGVFCFDYHRYLLHFIVYSFYILIISTVDVQKGNARFFYCCTVLLLLNPFYSEALHLCFNSLFY